LLLDEVVQIVFLLLLELFRLLLEDVFYAVLIQILFIDCACLFFVRWRPSRRQEMSKVRLRLFSLLNSVQMASISAFQVE
jgi:hypothetical protein